MNLGMRRSGVGLRECVPVPMTGATGLAVFARARLSFPAVVLLARSGASVEELSGSADVPEFYRDDPAMRKLILSAARCEKCLMDILPNKIGMLTRTGAIIVSTERFPASMMSHEISDLLQIPVDVAGEIWLAFVYGIVGGHAEFDRISVSPAPRNLTRLVLR